MKNENENEKSLKVPKVPTRRGRPRTAPQQQDRLATLDLALEVLKIIASNEGRMSLTQLSQLSGQPPNKLHRYLATLKHHGFIVQSNATGLYSIGPESYSLGVSAMRQFDPMAGVRAAISDIAATTGALCNLYVWTAAGPTMIMTEEGNYSFSVTFKLGAALPLCDSATGRVFLALMPRKMTSALLELELAEAEQDNIPISMDYVNAEIEKIRSAEIYWSSNAIITGIAGVLPLFNQQGQLACTITAILPRGSGQSELRAQVEEALLRAREKLVLGQPSGTTWENGKK